MSKFKELTPDMMGNRSTVRDYSLAFEDIRKIPLENIIIREGFNVRHDYGDIRSLANSILENGQSQPGRVDVLANGTFTLTDGHRRFEALKLLASEGHECYFMAVVNKTKTTDEQRIFQMFTTQDSKHLEPIEVAEIFARLSNLGLKQKDIAKKTGKTNTYVSQMLALSTEPVEIKEAISSGKLKVATAQKLRKAIPSDKERTAAVKSAISRNTNPISENAKSVEVSKDLLKHEKEKKAKKIVKAILMDARIKAVECEGELTADVILIELIAKYL
jgi:ParB/RepB/Spo0J family partition protein